MVRRPLLALAFVLAVAGCAAGSSATPDGPTAGSLRQAADDSCPVVPGAAVVTVTLMNRLTQTLSLSVPAGSFACDGWSGESSPGSWSGASVPPGDSLRMRLAVVPGRARQFPLGIIVDQVKVTTLPYAVRAANGEARQYLLDPGAGRLDCRTVNSWLFAIAEADARARITCDGELAVSFEYRM